MNKCRRHIVHGMLVALMLNSAMPMQAYPWNSSEQANRSSLRQTMNRWVSQPMVLGVITVLSLTALGSLAAYYFMQGELEEPNVHQNDEGDDGIGALLGADQQRQDFPIPNQDVPIHDQEEFDQALRLQQQYDDQKKEEEAELHEALLLQQEYDQRNIVNAGSGNRHEEGAGIEDFSDEDINGAGKEEADASDVNDDEFDFEHLLNEQSVDFKKEIEQFLLSDMPKSTSDIKDDIQRITTYKEIVDDSLRPKLKLRLLRDIVAITDDSEERRELQEQLKRLQADMRCSMLSKNK